MKMLDKIRKIMLLIMIATLLLDGVNFMKELRVDRIRQLYGGVRSEIFRPLLDETGNDGGIIDDTLRDKTELTERQKENLYLFYLM